MKKAYSNLFYKHKNKKILILLVLMFVAIVTPIGINKFSFDVRNRAASAKQTPIVSSTTTVAGWESSKLVDGNSNWNYIWSSKLYKDPNHTEYAGLDLGGIYSID